MTDDIILQKLARHIPDLHTKNWSLAMTEEEKMIRRRYIRDRITGTQFSGFTDEQLDHCRYNESEHCRMFWDEGGRPYVISLDISIQSQFRKAHSLIPFEYFGTTLTDFDWNVYKTDTAAQKKIIGTYLDGFNTEILQEGLGLYIFSSTRGSGKTMLACAIINEIATNYPVMSIKFVNVIDLLELEKLRWDDDSRGQVDQIFNCGVLVIDDIGAQSSKEWQDTVLYRIINKRYQEHKITIYTSNIPIEKLKIDPRTIDRMTARSYVIHLPEVSVRTLKADESKRKIMCTIDARVQNKRKTILTG